MCNKYTLCLCVNVNFVYTLQKMSYHYTLNLTNYLTLPHVSDMCQMGLKIGQPDYTLSRVRYTQLVFHGPYHICLTFSQHKYQMQEYADIRVERQQFLTS